MLDNKKKNKILSYDELITKILEYSWFNLDEEELKTKHSKIGKPFWVKWDTPSKEKALL